MAIGIKFTVVLIVTLISARKVLSSSFSGWKAKPFELSRVTLSPSSRYGQNQQRDLEYLLNLNTSRLTCLYVQAANLSTSCIPYPHPQYYGHFLGHYLSGSSMIIANTNNQTLLDKINQILNILQSCQNAWSMNGNDTSYSNGFLFPYSPVAFEILFGYIDGSLPVAVPFYVMHKMLAGLIDMYLHCKHIESLSMAIQLANWVVLNVEQAINDLGLPNWQNNVLNIEWGGMNEALYNLYGITNDTTYLKTANYFNHYIFTTPLVNNKNDLYGIHANTHIPEISGAARGYELNANNSFMDLTVNFFDIVNNTQSFATRGSNDHEYWGFPNQLGSELDSDTEESCTQYNILKVARYLFTWTADAKYFDFYEIGILNGLIGNQHVGESYEYIYFLPLGGAGLVKQWGSAYDSFVCCWGTLTESFGKLSDSIYFYGDNERKDDVDDDGDIIYVTQFVDSSVKWEVNNGDTDVTLRQTTNYPFSQVSDIKIHIDDNTCANFTVAIRIPWWIDDQESETYLKIVTNNRNNKNNNNMKNNAKNSETKIVKQIPFAEISTVKGDFLKLYHEWCDGDIIEIKLGMIPRFERINDNRTQWNNVGALLYGPLLLGGITDDPYIDINVNNINKMILYPNFNVSDPNAPTNGTFTLLLNDTSKIELIPQMNIMDEYYTMYFQSGMEPILPYNKNGSKIDFSNAYSMTYTGNAGSISNPLYSLRSGNPGEINNGTVMTKIVNNEYLVKQIEFDYQYVSGYSMTSDSDDAANFTLILEDSRTNEYIIVYESFHFVNYSYDECNTCYSPPVKSASDILNVNVTDAYQLKFIFQNNDRNVQLLFDSLNLTVYWS